MVKDRKEKYVTVSNLIWRFLERFSAQFVAFIVSIILARLLDPSSYGMIAIVTIIIKFLQVFIDSGLGNALIQKKDADDIDFSTVFFTNLLICILLYTLLFFVAPFIAVFFKQPGLGKIIRVLGIMLLISGVKNIQQAFVSKNLLFKKFFFATLSGTICAAIVGIFMAYLGFGVWALVAQQLVNTIIDTIVLWISVKWHPRFVFSLERLIHLFSYGWKLLVSSIIDTVYSDLRQIFIGRFYTSSELAYYNQGEKFPTVIVSTINSSINSVLFPVLAKNQDDLNNVKSITKKAIKMSSYIMWPLLLGLASISKTLVELVLTNKWLDCVPFMILACISFGLEPIQTANINVIKALGKSDVYLKIEIIKKSISILILFVSLKFGVLAIAIGSLFYCVIASFINSFLNKKYINYGYFAQIKDILPSLLLSVLMAIIVYLIPLGNILIPLKILIKILIGILFYIFVSALLKMEEFIYLKNLIFSVIKKEK